MCTRTPDGRRPLPVWKPGVPVLSTYAVSGLPVTLLITDKPIDVRFCGRPAVMVDSENVTGCPAPNDATVSCGRSLRNGVSNQRSRKLSCLYRSNGDNK